MQEYLIAKRILICLLFLFLLFLALFFIKKSYGLKVKKYEAITLCKYVITNKIDEKLINDLEKVSYESKKNELKVVLTFKKNTSNDYKNKAICIFNDKYINKYIMLKSFFYQDINNNIHIYLNSLISVKNIKACYLK